MFYCFNLRGNCRHLWLFLDFDKKNCVSLLDIYCDREGGSIGESEIHQSSSVSETILNSLLFLHTDRLELDETRLYNVLDSIANETVDTVPHMELI